MGHTRRACGRRLIGIQFSGGVSRPWRGAARLLRRERLVIEGEIVHHHEEIPGLPLEVLGMAWEERYLLEAEVGKDLNTRFLLRDKLYLQLVEAKVVSDLN